MMGAGFLSLLGTTLLTLVGFLGLRLVAARWAGIPGWRPIAAFDQKPWASVALGRRALFAFAGPFGAYLVAVLFFTVGLTIAGDQQIDETSMRVHVRPSGPAAEAGIHDGDQILSVDGVEIKTWDELRDAVQHHQRERAEVVVRREDKTITLPTTPVDGKIGVQPPIDRRSIGFVSAFGKGAAQPFVVLGTTAKNLVALVVGSEKPEVTGAMGIIKETGKTQREGSGQVLVLLGALISYFLLVPLLLLSLVFFPRAPRSS